MSQDKVVVVAGVGPGNGTAALSASIPQTHKEPL